MTKKRVSLPAFKVRAPGGVVQGIAIVFAVVVALAATAMSYNNKKIYLSPLSFIGEEYAAYMTYVYILAGIFVVLLLVLIAVRMRYNRLLHQKLPVSVTKPVTSPTQPAQAEVKVTATEPDLVNQARNLVIRARLSGYSDAEIARRFKAEGWSDASIQKMMAR